jgi:AP-3 complex subunit beta
VQECPSAFTPFLNDFFVKGMDPSFTRMIKLDILVSLCIDPAAIDAVLSELRTYVRHNDKPFACAAIRAVGKVAELTRVVYDRRAFTAGEDSDCARADANLIALNCLSGLVSLSEFSKNDLVVGECAETIQRILSQLWSKDTELKMQLVNDPAKVQERALKRLLLILVRALSLNDDSAQVRVPDAAVASTLWLVSEWATMTEAVVSPWSLDATKKAAIRLEILRLLASSFSELDPQIKLQGVHLSSKVLLMLKTEQSSPATADKEGALCEFILAMGRIDVLQDVRDRSRYESNILHASIILTRDTSTLQSAPEGSTLSDDKAKSMLSSRKPTASSLPLDANEFGSVQAETDMFRFGTLSSVMSSRTSVSGLPLPKWANVNSSGSLRDQSVDNADGTAGSNNEDMYSSSSEEDSSSSSSSSSAGDSSSSEESDSDEESTSGSDDSTVEDKPVTLDAFGSNGFGINPTIPVPTQRNNTQVASLLNNDTDDSSSSSSDYDSDSSSESDDSSKEVVPAQPSVGNIFDMDSVPSNAVPVQYAKQVSNGSSVAAGLEDLVMTPLVVDRDDADVSSNGSNESGPWIEFVKSELAGGLSVRMRFVHGRSRIKEAKMMGLDSDNTSTVCLQAHIENKRSDSGTLRHIRIVHRPSTSSGMISTSKVVSPPEIPALKTGKASSVFIGLTFSSTTDRDGVALAKFDIKSDRGSTSIEIRPTLGEFMDSSKVTMSQSEFDSKVADLHGIHQRITSTFSLSPMNDDVYTNLPKTILQHLNLKQIGTWPGKGCFVGVLPASEQYVYVVVKCDPVTGSGDLIVCGNNAMASNSILNLLKQALTHCK